VPASIPADHTIHFDPNAPFESLPPPYPEPSPDREPDDDDDDDASKMGFLEHLDELRRRLLYSVVALFVGFLAAFAFIDHIFAFIMRPLTAVLPAGGKLVFTEPTEAFMLYI
jgi:sec-independent protein translocase protein TatC